MATIRFINWESFKVSYLISVRYATGFKWVELETIELRLCSMTLIPK